jgi:hypothetical protein
MAASGARPYVRLENLIKVRCSRRRESQLRSWTAPWFRNEMHPETRSPVSTPWDGLHRAYFNGCALWTYLTTPFLLAMDGVRVEEVEPWREGAETWRVLRAQFPGSIETHSRIQEFFFDTALQLRRHDYSLNITGDFPAAHLTSRTEFICRPSAAPTRAGLTAGRLWKC